MSEISDRASVHLFLADYATIDPANRINALGIGFQVAILQQGGLTSPQAVTAIVEFEPKHAGDDCAIELALLDDSDQVVGQPQAPDQMVPLRFSQNVTIERPNIAVQGVRVPKDALRPRHQMVANMASGLLLPPGHAYRWQVFIDTQTQPHWSVEFYVPAPAGQVLLG